jgi:hypothetical protein
MKKSCFQNKNKNKKNKIKQWKEKKQNKFRRETFGLEEK